MMYDELKRKAIHFIGLFYIPGILILGKNSVSIIFFALTAVAFILEILRIKGKIELRFLRNHERKTFASYLYTGIAFSSITFLASEEACIVAASCAFGGDGISGIVKRIRKELAIPSFILVSFVLSILFDTQPIPSFFSALIASLADGRKFEDNFTIPLIASITYTLLANLNI